MTHIKIQQIPIPNSDLALEIRSYNSDIEGPYVLATGAVHGNEKCGTRAIDRTIIDIKQGQLEIKQGSFVAIHICNPLAYSANQRFIGENLNRIVAHQTDFPTEEHKIAEALCTAIDTITEEFGTDGTWLDLHSSHNKGDMPCIILDHETQANYEIAKKMGLPAILTGWTPMFSENGVITEPCTINYGHEKGLRGFTIECGGHNDKTAPEVAEQALRNAMIHQGLIEGTLDTAANPSTLIQLEKIVKRPPGPGHLTQNWKNGDRVTAGQPIAEFNGSTTLSFPKDGHVIIPQADAPEGRTWYYEGYEVAESKLALS